MKKRGTEKYKYCNHHHEIDEQHELVNFGDGDFVANKEAIPLLKALNEVGLRTRSHHIASEEHAFVCILLDNVEIEVKEVYERDANRTKYNGKKELLIKWKKTMPSCDHDWILLAEQHHDGYIEYSECSKCGDQGGAKLAYRSQN